MIQLGAGSQGAPSLIIDEDDVLGFVDRDWIHPSAAIAVPALVLGVDGKLRWGEKELPSAGEEPTVRAGQLISAFAADVVASVPEVDGESVQVTGAGMTAALVRRRLGCRGESRIRPRAVVELSGMVSEVTNATRSVRDGGVVVVAGEYGEALDLNIYSDVHRRGITVIGVPGVGSERSMAGGGDRYEGDSTEGPLLEPVSVRAGAPIPSGQWYRVVKEPGPAT